VQLWRQNIALPRWQAELTRSWSGRIRFWRNWTRKSPWSRWHQCTWGDIHTAWHSRCRRDQEQSLTISDYWTRLQQEIELCFSSCAASPNPLGTSTNNWPTVQSPDGMLWSRWWNKNWRRKIKYSERTPPPLSDTLHITNPTWPGLGSNPCRRGRKQATKRLSLWRGPQTHSLPHWRAEWHHAHLTALASFLTKRSIFPGAALIVANTTVARQRPRNKQLYNGRFWAAAVELNQRSGVFCYSRAMFAWRKNRKAVGICIFCAVRAEAT
jgi:hypothetical protein